MTRFFFDDYGELEEYQTFRRQDQPLAMEHLKIRVALRDAEAALRTQPETEGIKAEIEELKKKLAGLDQQAPWITFDYPLEILLWGPPHG